MTTGRMASVAPCREQCVSCAYPIDADGDIFAVLSRLKGMMAHVGYTVDRLLVEESRDSAGTKSVTLLLRPSPSSSSKRLCPSSPDRFSLEPASKRMGVPGCRLCVSSCCSTNSLCKANVCGHRGEEESAPTPSSPERHRYHVRARKHGHSHPHAHPYPVPAPGPRPQDNHRHGQRAKPAPVVHDSRLPAPPISLLPERDREKAIVVPQTNDHVQLDEKSQDVGYQEAKRRTPELSNELQRSDPEVRQGEPPTSFTRSRNTHADPAIVIQPAQLERTQEKRNDSQWTATTAPRGAAIDPTCSQRLGPVDFPGRCGAVMPVALRPRQTGLVTGTAVLRRSSQGSPMSGVTSFEANRGLIGAGARDEEKACRDGEQGGTASAPRTMATRICLRRPPPELVCQPCRLNFSEELELRRHQFMEHKEGKIGMRTNEGRFMCLMNSCTQSFVRRHVMERHFKSVHMLVREFPCSSCDKSFADSSTREAHRSAVHEKRKPYICDQCSSCFTQSSSLGKHRRRFHKEALTSRVRTKG